MYDFNNVNIYGFVKTAFDKIYQTLEQFVKTDSQIKFLVTPETQHVLPKKYKNRWTCMTMRVGDVIEFTVSVYRLAAVLLFERFVESVGKTDGYADEEKLPTVSHVSVGYLINRRGERLLSSLAGKRMR